MKKAIALTLAGALAVGLLTACGSAGGASESEEKQDVVVFAAASMTETLNEAAALYKESHPNVNLIFTFDSSGTLKTQIQEGADCDLFISAAQKQMDQLDAAASSAVNTEGLDFVQTDTRVNLLENKVVLVVPKNNPAGINSFDDLASNQLKLIALGNADVPVGQYSQDILTALGLWDELNKEGKITFGSNVKQVTSQVSEGAVDCGMVYATDAYSEGLTVVASAPEGTHKPVIYPAAVLKTAKNAQGAKDFLAFLQTDECKAIFEKVGFSIPESGK